MTNSQIFSKNGSAIATAQGKVWVVHGERGSGLVTVLDADSLSIDQQLPLDRFMTTIAANERSVYVGGGEWDRSGMVIKLDAASGREQARVVLPDQFVGTLLADGGEVLAIGRKGRIWRMSSRDLSIRSVIDLSIGPFEPHKAVRVGDRLAITTHRGQGENGSVVVVSGIGRGLQCRVDHPAVSRASICRRMEVADRLSIAQRRSLRRSARSAATPRWRASTCNFPGTSIWRLPISRYRRLAGRPVTSKSFAMGRRPGWCGAINAAVMSPVWPRSIKIGCGI
ncbi:MAG: hypothetical protein R3D67_00035 [Hyphomicrobiaceae bacterium]